MNKSVRLLPSKPNAPLKAHRQSPPPPPPPPASIKHVKRRNKKKDKDSAHHRRIIAGLKSCAMHKDFEGGAEIHDQIVKLDALEKNLAIGCALVDMYAKCGSLTKAKESFDKLPSRDAVSWTCLISGYTHHGHYEEALRFFEQMKREGIYPDAFTLVFVLKACGALGFVDKGQETHTEAEMKGWSVKNVFIGSALVEMYAKCGSIVTAYYIFEMLPIQDVVLWNVLIVGYTNHGQDKKALECFEEMLRKSVCPNVGTFVSIAKACGNLGAIGKGREVHAMFERGGFVVEDNVFGNVLIYMYGKCGLLGKAHDVFSGLLAPDVLSWNSLIVGYAEHDQSVQVLHNLRRMKIEGVLLNAIAVTSGLKACAALGEICVGLQVHVWIENVGVHESDIIVGSALVDMYAKCGVLSKAQEMFDRLPVRDAILWTALISGCSEHGHAEEVFSQYKLMQIEGIPPNAITFISILKVCATVQVMYDIQEIHADIEKCGFLNGDIVLGSSLVDIYARLGFLYEAQQVFDKLLLRNVVSWTSLAGGYAEHGQGLKALVCYEEMQFEGVLPTPLSIVCSLRACCCERAARKGQEIHAEIEKWGILEDDPFIGSALVHMYVKCGTLSEAQNVFNKLRHKDQILWNVLIGGYAEHFHGEGALECFKQMELHGVDPNDVTYISMLKACYGIGMSHMGQKICDAIGRYGFEGDLAIGSTLVSMYAKCGMLVQAERAFEKLCFRSTSSWNSLIMGYAEHGYGEDALKCIERMRMEGITSDSVTCIGTFTACGNMGSRNKGAALHAEAEKKGFLETEASVGNALIHMYARSHSQDKAQRVFDKLRIRNVVSWTALMAGYVQAGESESVFGFFDRMLAECVRPDAITFVVILSACTRIGFTCQSQMYFEAMGERYHIIPLMEHESCMIDLLGRVGDLQKATALISGNPFAANVFIWQSLLSACRKWGTMELGEHAFKQMKYMIE